MTITMIPLYGFLEGDTMGVVVLADADDTIEALALRLETSAGPRVAPAPAGSGRWRVMVQGRVLEPDATVAEAGLHALDRFDVVSVGQLGQQLVGGGPA